MARPIKHVVVVGGGTAGWISAAYLNRAFGRAVDITLVESPAIPRIGVGEATVPTLRTTFAFLGMEEEDWMPRCNAAFKSGVKLVDWRSPRPDGTRHTYYHPFFSVPEKQIATFDKPFHGRYASGFSLPHFWLRRRLAGDRSVPETYGEAGMPLQRLMELGKAPRPLPGSGERDPRFRYAYHFDAALIAGYLCELATGRGVRHVRAEIGTVERDQRGHITTLRTTDGREITGDLFLDCTGFRGLLINKALGEPFVGQNDFLLCDRAVSIPARNDPERDGLRPYTTATAQTDGWTWEIPLYHRDGAGYVYSSVTTTPDRAERTLRGFLGDRAYDIEPNHITMRVGYTKRTWVGNCIAVGLSSCFVEPLESTTIALIEYELALLLLHFPDSDFDELRTRRYNDLMSTAYEDLRDFIVMHYCLTDRTDTEFWRTVRELPLPDTLQRKLAEYAESVITPDGTQQRLFETQSIWAILSGMGFGFTKAPPGIDLLDDTAAAERFREIDKERAELSAGLPDHYAYLRALHGEHRPSPV